MAKTETLGIGDMRANFGQLKTGMATRTSRRMVVAAGGVLKKQAKANIQAAGLVRTGAMLKNVVIKREPQAPAGTTEYNLGVRHGRNLTKKQKANGKLAVSGKGRVVRRYEDDPYYWRFLEFDTRRRQGTHYLANTLEQSRQAAIDAMGNALDKELEKAGKP